MCPSFGARRWCVARRFSLFRRSEPGEAHEPAPASDGEGHSAGFGFVTMGTDNAAADGDPDQPIVLGSVYNAEPAPGDIDRPIVLGSLFNGEAAKGGNDVAMEKITLTHEGMQLDAQTEINGLSHEVKSPPDSAAAGESIQIHGQYDMDTTIEAEGGPFEMADAAADGPSTSVNLFRGEVTSIEPAFRDAEALSDSSPDDLEVFD